MRLLSLSMGFLLQLQPCTSLSLTGVPCPFEVPQDACFPAPDDHDVHFDTLDLPLLHTVEYVRDLLQQVIKVEHATIPLYLMTRFSVVNQSSFEANLLKSVVVEEMMHMTNAANVLNAIGGAPSIDDPAFIPQYPLVIPLINVSASLTWLSNATIAHYQMLELVPPGGYNSSITAAYLHIIQLLTTLCTQHGEANVFTGDPTLQVGAFTDAPKIFTLQDATNMMLDVSDQGGGCPVNGKPWPEFANISAGPLGNNLSHAARFTELLDGRMFRASDITIEHGPTGPALDTDWKNVRRFVPNPTLNDFLPENCIEGGSWILRESTFFVLDLWKDKKSYTADTTDTWQECARYCKDWTISMLDPLEACAMWSWLEGDMPELGLKKHTCLLGQQFVRPSTKEFPGFISGCLFGTVCNNSIPAYPNASSTTSATLVTASPTPEPLAQKCSEIHTQRLEFAANYTKFLVLLHNAFNGQPDTLMDTVTQMLQLKSMAIDLLETFDPRFADKFHPGDRYQLGVGAPWEYVASASQYELRGRRARPIAPPALY